MRLNVYGFLQFFRDFSNCFFSSLFVKNMPKHATRVKGVPGAFVREIRTINCDQPRLAQGPQRADQGPGARARGHRPRDLARRARARGPGIAQGSAGDRPGIAQGSPRDRPGIAQGSPTRARGTRYVYKGSRAGQGGQDRRGFTWGRLPGEKKARRYGRASRARLAARG
jgi:hypothetical protein